MISIHFKQINDTYGHEIRDIVLKRVGEEARRMQTLAGRLGGEEIAFLIAGGLADAIEVAEGFRESVSKLEISCGNEVVRLTCSVGAAECEHGDTLDALLRRADVSLYEAKRLGRNRVVAADTFRMLKEHGEWRGVTRQTSRRFG